MFEAFYNLSTNPFRLTPDPKFCFRHPSYNQAYAYLQYALKLGEGFIMVTGRPGIGKTTLVEVFLTEIEQSEVVAARIASANVEAADLLRVVAYSYGIDVVGLDKATVLLRLEQFFIRQTRSGRRVLLIIDEAQGLPHVALEELRLLADLQMDSCPLLQLFLVGQEKLRDLMRKPDMEQFQQRVIGACHLEPLDLTESRSYMEHRLRTAGWKGDPELTGAAVLSLYQYSKGVPRHVNKICTRLLLHGMLGEKHELQEEDVLTVAEELRAEQLAPMERDEKVSPDAAEPVPVPELDSGALSIADLALRVDRQEAEQQEVGNQPATSAASELANQAAAAAVSEVGNQVNAAPSAQDPELAAVSNGRGTARIPPQRPGWGAASADRPGLRQQDSRHRPSGVGEFPGQLRRRPKQARAAVSPRAAAPPAKQRTARRDKAAKRVKALLARSAAWRGETARMFGRLGWKGKVAVLVTALLVVNLTTAVLMTRFMGESGDHKSFKQVAVRDDDTVARAQAEASAGQQAAGSRDDWFENIVETWDREAVIASRRGGLPEQPVSDSAVTVPPVQETVPAAPEPDMTAVESSVETAAKHNDIPVKADEQIGAGDSTAIQASAVPGSQPGPALMQDESDPREEEPVAEPVDSANSAIPTKVPEVVAKATPSASGEVAPAVPAEEKKVPPPVTRQEKIAELLSRGQQSLKRDRLLIPTTDSAYKYYQQTLILDPGNEEALVGIERILARYIVLARNALARQDEDKSRRYVERGLSINPTDKRLLALRDSLNAPGVDAEAEAEAEAEAQTLAAQTDEQTPVAEQEPEPQAQSFVSRLKAFFTKGRSADKSREVVVEER